jgi:hypothetical protein
MGRRISSVAATLCAVSLAAAGAASAKTVLPGFHSPSGNIRCFAVHGTLRCQLAHADYAKTLQARCSGLDWHGFELAATRKGGVTCSGGILYSPATERPVYVNLPYGRTWRQGVFTCTSRLAGVTCTNRAGHGLFVSRQTWRAW